MYPNFYYLFKDLFGVEIDALIYINSFGFFVALSFLAANFLMVKELKRKEENGELLPRKVKVVYGKRPGIIDYALNAVIGFLIGYKLIYLVSNATEIRNSGNSPQDFIMSSDGSVLWGIIIAALLVGWRYWEVMKVAKKYPKEVTVEETFHPYQAMGTITIVAAVAGLLGAKIFDHMEHWDEFVKNPLGAFLDPFSGLTFYGGLICGGAAVLIVAKRYGIHWRKMLDVGGPAMMFAYASGRIGCQVSGDGDWGIVNTLDKPGWLSWLPDWAWSYDYPNNVAHICNPYVGAERDLHSCTWEESGRLIAGVFPTPLYEIVAGMLLFVILWKLRKKLTVPGMLFSLYLFLAGFERFWIEKIRVNATYHIFGSEITQAEIISSVLMIVGLGTFLLLYYRKKKGIAMDPKVSPVNEETSDQE